MAIAINIKGGTVQLSGNPIEVECTGGSAPAASTGYVILLRVISVDGSLFGAPFVDAKEPDDDGKATFKVQAYTDQPMQKRFQYPASGVCVAYSSGAKKIQFQAGEYWLDEDGISHEEWGEVVDDTIQVLKGGTNPRQLSLMSDLGTSFFDLYVQGDKWLTTRPWGDEIHPDQQVKLWFIVDAAKTATLNIYVKYLDGAESTFKSGSIALDPDNLYEFNCNPATHGVSLEHEGAKADYIDVWLDFGGTSSERRRFHFDNRYIERPVFLWFTNSLGGIDDVYFSGFVKEDFETEGDVAEYPYQSTDTVFDGTLRPSGKTGQNQFVFNSGYKAVTTVQFYRDLILSQQCWHLYYNVSNVPAFIIPIIIDKGSYRIADRQEDLHTIEFTASEAHRSPFAFDNRQF